SQVESLPQVAHTVRFDLFGAEDELEVHASGDPAFNRVMDRPKTLAGRLPRPAALHEPAANFQQAEFHALHVGSAITVRFARLGHEQGGPAVPFTFHIVGIEARAGEFPPQFGTPSILASAAFDRTYRHTFSNFTADAIRLKRGFADIDPFLNGLHRFQGKKILFPLRQDTSAPNVERSFHLQSIALWLLAGLMAVVVILVFGQTLARQTYLESDENPALRSLGMTRSQLMGVAAVRALLVAAAGAVVAVLVASAA